MLQPSGFTPRARPEWVGMADKALIVPALTHVGNIELPCIRESSILSNKWHAVSS